MGDMGTTMMAHQTGIDAPGSGIRRPAGTVAVMMITSSAADRHRHDGERPGGPVRPGAMADITAKLLQQFVDNLEANVLA
jgi:hypothetical protein